MPRAVPDPLSGIERRSARAVALVVWFILYAVYRKGAAPLERRLNAMEQEDVVS